MVAGHGGGGIKGQKGSIGFGLEDVAAPGRHWLLPHD